MRKKPRGERAWRDAEEEKCQKSHALRRAVGHGSEKWHKKPRARERLGGAGGEKRGKSRARGRGAGGERRGAK